MTTEITTERLERIKKSAKWLHCFNGHLDVKSISDDMNWLIEQAERAQEMKKTNDSLSEESRGNFQETLDYRRENKRLREALEFYADSKNFEVNVVDQWAPEIKVMMDGGAKAAELLERLK